MAYKKYFKKGEENSYKSQNYMDQTTYGYQGKPDSESKVDAMISFKALKNLAHSSYSFRADPYTAALPTSEPYPLLNAFNKVVGANYQGDNNIDGGNVQQYSNSVTSKFLKIFDVIRTEIDLNYRYLPITYTGSDDLGKGLIDEMRKSISEALSILNSTTFTQLAINNFAVVTDMNMGSATTTNISNTNTAINAYTNTTDVLYAMSIYYQIFLQNTLGVMNWHNSFRLKQGCMIRNAWNREVPNLNAFFGLMNKKSFHSQLNSINLSFEGEFVDREFMEQTNILSAMPSRRSNSLNDPVLELQVGWAHPTTFQVYILNPTTGKILDNVNQRAIYDDGMLNASVSINGSETNVTYWDACENLRDYLSMESTVAWARGVYNSGNTGTEQTRFNNISNWFSVINTSFVKFKPLWSDYRETLDVMSRTGTLSWTKGFRPSIVKESDAPMFHVLLIENIFGFLIAGPEEVTYNNDTKRWRTYTKWNIYHGIPDYDLYNGGSFLSFAFKNFSGDTYKEQTPYIPVLFSKHANSANTPAVSCISRDGARATVTYATTTMSTNKVLRRLVPLTSQANETIRIPTLAYAGNTSLDADHRSMLYKTLSQIFGFCKVQYTSGGEYDFALDPDILAIYQIEITDITNSAITYARAHAPFRGTTSSLDTIGFKAFRKV